MQRGRPVIGVEKEVVREGGGLPRPLPVLVPVVVEPPLTAEPAARRGWRQALPFLLGAAMFAVALWVLHRTLARYNLGQVQNELAALKPQQILLALLFTGLSFVSLIGYEISSLRLIGRRRQVPFPLLSLASFVTQSICHSTGFAFVIGATLRYQFYAKRGLTVVDVAKIQLLFTATFTLGVSTLAGGVFLIEPYRLAAVTNLPAWLWRLGAAGGLAAVAAYVGWGLFFNRPFTVRGRSLSLPDPQRTLFQIACGVADLLAVSAALYTLLPAALHLSYLELLALFMAALVVGLMSHVPGSLGVLEGAIILLIQPGDEQALPLIGALLAFRACYYLLPLCCGVTLLAVYEGVRWRKVLAHPFAGLGTRLLPLLPPFAAGLTALSGALLLLATATPVPHARAELLAATLPRAVAGSGNLLCSGLGVGLLVLTRGVLLRVARAWGWGVLMLLAGLLVCLAAGESAAVWLPLLLTLVLLLLARSEFMRPAPRLSAWLTPAWLAVCTAGAVLAAFFLTRG